MIFNHIFDSFYHYFIALFVNTDLQLLIFLLAILAMIVFIRIRDVIKIEKCRHNIGLSIGSWGTRGKSGTERLKAAVFHGLGFNFVSKTTGTEPNLVLGGYLGASVEIPLYRPYDYANIKEQIRILKFADKINASVFLWECMAINPDYSAILQKWMRDDLTTIINTYPDHENIQGPRGMDVAHSLTYVIPKNSTLLTTEEAMLPVLEAQCQRVQTTMITVDAIQSELITEDVLNSFPYPVYYKNLALVLRLFDMMGVNKQITLSHVKNHIVPDIGCFRIFNPAWRDKRNIRLVNCMSANDQYSTLISLKSMKYDAMTIAQKPMCWLFLCINNRYDRISRSYNFAQTITSELQADRYAVMGTNVHLMMTLIKKFWKVRLERFLVWIENESIENIKIEYHQMIFWLRIPTTSAMFLQRFSKSMFYLLNKHSTEDSLSNDIKEMTTLTSINIEHGDSLVKLLLEQYTTLNEYQESMKLFDAVKSKKVLREQLIQHITKWYFNKFILITNHRANGDEINTVAYANTPLYLDGYFVCLANIRGPGIAVSYSWLMWSEIEKACNLLLSDQVEAYPEALNYLLQQPCYNVISSPAVGAMVKTLLERNQLGDVKEKLLKIEKILAFSRLSDLIKKRETLKNRILTGLVQQIENFLEPGNSITRKKHVDMIYEQLSAHLISVKEAKTQLNRLLMKQKGGWLMQLILQRRK